MRDEKKANMALTLCLWTVFGTLGMILMLKTGLEKTIVITDKAQGEAGFGEGIGQDGEMPEAYQGSRLTFTETQTFEKQFVIPLQEGIKAENVTMENRYMDRELWLQIEGAEQDFYMESAIYGDTASMENGYCEEFRDGVVLKLQMKEVLEYYSTMENNTLVIAYDKPEDIYEHIVVIDPVGGGSKAGSVKKDLAEKDLALQVALLLQQKTFPEDTKIYFTRTEDKDVSTKERLLFVEEVGASLYLGLCGADDMENTEKYGIQGFYNEAYFIPGFGNVEWADAVTRNVTIAASNRAVGLFAVPDTDILAQIKIPAARVSLGYLSNAKERDLLRQSSYREKLAEGIWNAITEVCRSGE